MKPLETVHRLLFQALLEMREAGRESRNKVTYHLADLFHTVVLDMQQAADGDIDYQQVLDLLEERARAKGSEQWVKNQIQEMLDNASRQQSEAEVGK